MNPDIGTYFDLAAATAGSREMSLSYLARDWPDREAWRSQARGKVHELLDFTPPQVPLNATVDAQRVDRLEAGPTGRLEAGPTGRLEAGPTRKEDGGLVVETISYDQPFGPRTEGFFLYPAETSAPLPAVVALHDHGGFKYWGKEKITDIPDQPPILQEFQERCYGSRGWATALARRGYAVLVADLFLWGSRRTQVASLPPAQQARFEGLEPGSREYIEKYHAWAAEHEHLLAKTLFAAGTTWPGIFSYEDRRSVDYLLTRPEIDPERIGCGGLSGGGLRTIFLAGLDPRIRCGVCVGFMSTFEELLHSNVKCHTWMLYLPRLLSYLDMPDLIALRVPAPLMVQMDTEDDLYTLQGQQDADAKIAAIYEKAGYPDHYSGRYYPGPHKFDLEMQEDAFDWFDRWLK